jgi:Protein of unknown function (DUF3775)
MLSVPIDRITMLLEQASQVASTSVDETDDDEALTAGETASTGAAEDFVGLPGYPELAAMLSDLTTDEVYELLALAAIGAGGLAEDSWDMAVAQAQSVAADEAVLELARILVVTDAIENALDRLGYTLSDEDDEDDDEDEDDEEDEDNEEEKS